MYNECYIHTHTIHEHEVQLDRMKVLQKKSNRFQMILNAKLNLFLMRIVEFKWTVGIMADYIKSHSCITYSYL